MDFLATPTRRKVLFGWLYFSEGAPIGFIWLGLATRLRAVDVPVEKITWLMALLILPWTLKFLWAPLVDLLRGSRWGFKEWILVSQVCMALTLLPLMWNDLETQFEVVSFWLLLHATSAATQDIAIDALCVQESQPSERASLNGWMQCGVLLGRALMGGGSLVLEHWIGFQGVVCVLMLIICSSSILVWFSSERRHCGVDPLSQKAGSGSVGSEATQSGRWATIRALGEAIRSRNVWIGFLFALIAPAAFKSLEAIIGPFLIDRDYNELEIGRFTATVMIGGMILGSLAAGRFGRYAKGERLVAGALLLNVAAIGLLAVADWISGGRSGWHLLSMLAVVACTIGWFTVSLYQWLMNLTSRQVAATQFTAFMAATNACEAWSTALFGVLQSRLGYPPAILVLCCISLIPLSLLLIQHASCRRERSEPLAD